MSFLMFILMSIALCPDHGVNSTSTGNRKVSGKVWYCEYEHPLSKGGVHKFWKVCE
jgi:hypothetical protein